MKSKSKFLIFFIILTGCLFAENIDYYFKEANNLYEQKKFDEAVKIYRNLVDQGVVSKELFFNISNAYYRIGELGNAVAFIEKAYLIAPRDKDIQYNRKFYLEKVNGTKDLAISFLSINELAVLFVILFGLLFVLLIISLFFNTRFLFLSKVILSFGLFFNILGLILHYYSDFRYPKAVVIQDEAVVYTAPNEQEQAIFTLKEASQVLVEDSRENWLSIYIKEHGLKGWIKDKDVECV